jgi:hypothetical protein
MILSCSVNGITLTDSISSNISAFIVSVVVISLRAKNQQIGVSLSENLKGNLANSSTSDLEQKRPVKRAFFHRVITDANY